MTLAVDVREWRKRKDISRPFGVDLLGRSPVQPVLDLAGSDARGQAVDAPGTTSVDGNDAGNTGAPRPVSEPVEDSPAAAGATESDAPANGDSGPTHETEGAGVTALVAAPAPAGDADA